MTGDPIPPADHLAIHCQPSHLLEVDGAGVPSGVSPGVFRVDDDGISSNWIEFEGNDFHVQFATACLLLTSGRKVRPNHRVGVLVVAEILAAGSSAGKVVAVVHDPLDAPLNPGHTLIKGIAAEDDTLLYDLAVLTELRPFTDEAVRVSKEAAARRGI